MTNVVWELNENLLAGLHMALNTACPPNYEPAYIRALRESLARAEAEAERLEREARTGICDRCGKSTRSHFGYCGMDM